MLVSGAALFCVCSRLPSPFWNDSVPNQTFDVFEEGFS